jgi:vacuolar-type H+-ATPase subunit I/STV1
MTTLIEEVTAASGTDRADALARYAELLARNDQPRQGDAQALREAMKALGKTAGDLAADLDVLNRAASLDAQVAGVEAIDREIQEAAAAVETAMVEHRRVTTEQNARLRDASARLNGLHNRQRAAEDARRELHELRRRHFSLFGLPEVKAAPTEEPVQVFGALAGEPEEVYVPLPFISEPYPARG